MLVLRVNGWVVDMIARLPLALFIDYVIGPAWSWPPLPPSLNESIMRLKYLNPSTVPSPPGSPTLLEFFNALGLRLSLASAVLGAWLVIRCYPTSQIVLWALWMETLALFAAVLGLNMLTIFTTIFFWIPIYLAVQILHAWMAYNLRQLRMLESMGLPNAGRLYGLPVIHDGILMFFWPKMPAVVGAVQIFWYPIADESWRLSFFVTVISVTAAPALYYLTSAFVWRLYSSYIMMKIRYRGTISVRIVTPYYAALEAVIWQTVGEDPINRAYAAVLFSRVFYRFSLNFYGNGAQSAIQDLSQNLVDNTVNSWITIFGACWVVSAVYHYAMEHWVQGMQLSLTDSDSREFDVMKYDLCGYLIIFCSLANLTAYPVAQIHLLRLCIFFVLYRLSKLSLYALGHCRIAAMDEVDDHILFIRTVADGALAVLIAGFFLAHRMWQAPLKIRELLTSGWLKDRSTLFTPEFEMWMHGEASLAVGDLIVLSCVILINAVASYAHLIKKRPPKLWHVVLQRTDWFASLWKHGIREALAIALHSVVLTLLWEDRVDMIFLTVIYLSRLMDAMTALHQAVVRGLDGQIFCWSKCIIYALQSPDEATFAAWNDFCSICRLEEDDRLSICTLPCGHYFHRECIEEWLKRQMKCPMCMRKIWFDNGDVKMDKT
ncbi:uncharacterized protein LOC129586769 [Paramacrobiotus metropolitanus]|uniref:uncharacterized protein LOC129586769 n=1 Tax=Paramacrobiotus metropolitanus TaxID=2943436 RepID=UPI00244560D7|nr:uncharacterized protein LOC129586769 [Paramacrobiotus metropolitanus]